MATENAISAVAKILKYNSSEVNTNDFISRFIEWLPIWNDQEEVPYVYDYFCDLVEAQHQAVQNNPARIFQVYIVNYYNLSKFTL
jgi:hypothetical protein